MPSSTAFSISGESAFASNVPCGPIPSLANRAMISVSAGFGGQNPSTKLRMVKNSGEVLSASGLSGLMKSTAGGAGGAGLPRNCDSG